MKKMSKVLSIMLMIMMLVMITTNVFAIPNDITPKTMDGNADVNVGGITTLGNSVVKIITTAGIVVSVIILVVLGIKYMMGSAEEKAEYKKTLMPYVIGAALVFAASSIATVVFNFATSINIA